MARKKKFLPFWMMPGSWGLSGKTYEENKARYYYDGVDLEERLLEINQVQGTVEYNIEKIKIAYNRGELGLREANKAIATCQGLAFIEGDVMYQGDGGVAFDFDWNHIWIEELRQNGYVGNTDQDIMANWFAAMCHNELIAAGGEDIDPFLYESIRSNLDKLIHRKDEGV